MLGLGHEIVKVAVEAPVKAAPPLRRRRHVRKGGEIATDLKVSVRRQIDRLREELAVATGQVAALRDEIKRHELVL